MTAGAPPRWAYLVNLSTVAALEAEKLLWEPIAEMPAEVYYAAERIIEGRGEKADFERIGAEQEKV